MKKLSVFLFLVMLFSCKNGFSEDSQNSFKIALILPDDPAAQSSLGTEARCIADGYLSGIKKLSNIELVYEFFDNKRSPLETARVAESISKNRYDIAIGTINSNEALVASKILNDNKIPFITPTSSHPDVTRDKPYAIRMSFDDNLQALLLAKFASSDLDTSKIIVAKNLSSNYSRYLADRFTKEIKQLNQKSTIKHYEFVKEENKYKGLIDLINDYEPTLLFLPLTPFHARNIYNLLVSMDRPFTLLGGDNIGGRPTFFKGVSHTPESVKFYFSKQSNDKLTGPNLNLFDKIYTENCTQYSKSMFSAAIFDSLNIVITSLKRSPSARGKDLIKEIKRYKYDGLYGKVVFKDSNTPLKPVYIFQIKDMRRSEVRRVNIE